MVAVPKLLVGPLVADVFSTVLVVGGDERLKRRDVHTGAWQRPLPAQQDAFVAAITLFVVAFDPLPAAHEVLPAAIDPLRSAFLGNRLA